MTISHPASFRLAQIHIGKSPAGPQKPVRGGLLRYRSLDMTGPLQFGPSWKDVNRGKARKAIAVPLNDMAVGVLKRQAGKHPLFVFTFHERPIGQVDTKAWTKALKRAGIEDFRWHDLRHTWASWLTQNGVPLNALQEMEAWQSAEMVRRYAHLAPEQFIRHAQVVDQLMAGVTSAPQPINAKRVTVT